MEVVLKHCVARYLYYSWIESGVNIYQDFIINRHIYCKFPLSIDKQYINETVMFIAKYWHVLLVLYGWQILFCHSEFHELDENGFAKRPITKVTYDPRDDDEESSYEEYYEEGSLSWLVACVLVCLGLFMDGVCFSWPVYWWNVYLDAVVEMVCFLLEKWIKCF